tara:strand:- start:15 stop:395 length:381 start_codon:yes stop_codon:yes gene_type:complete
MSVLAQKTTIYFQAPLSIGEHKVTASGSWSAVGPVHSMDPAQLLRMRLHTWKQQFDSKVCNVCLDWAVTHDSGSARHALVIQFDDRAFGACLHDAAFGAHIQRILDDSHTIVPVAKAFSSCTQARV